LALFVNGWQANIIASLSTGTPFTVYDSADVSQQLNPATQAGQFGNEGRNVVRGPGIEDVDFSLFKNFNATERAHLQFRAEVFNPLNHANLGLPENDLESPAFGQILQAGSPRLLQLAIKLNF
jgi:hypothetical protein